MNRLAIMRSKQPEDVYSSRICIMAWLVGDEHHWLFAMRSASHDLTAQVVT